PAATVHLAETSVVGSGPKGPSVTLNLALSFKPQAAGRSYVVEVAATDDLGNQQGFAPAGSLTIEALGAAELSSAAQPGGPPAEAAASSPLRFDATARPNPAGTEATTISYVIPAALGGTRVEVAIFDVAG